MKVVIMKTELNFLSAVKKSSILAITFLAISTQVLAQEKLKQNKKIWRQHHHQKQVIFP
jgi:hypothetical protein